MQIVADPDPRVTGVQEALELAPASATTFRITHVHLPSPHHLYWPDLDVDLAVESIEHPEQYPLVSQVAQPGASAGK
jgi:hypothetical protein